MPTFTLDLHNYTGKPFSITFTNTLQDNKNPPKTIDNVVPYTLQTPNMTIQFDVNYPYDTFTFFSKDYYGQTDYNKLGGSGDTFTVDKQWSYTIAVGIAPNKFIDANGNDVSAVATSEINGEVCTTGSGTCGYAYLNKYPSWLAYISDFGAIKSSLKHISVFAIIIIVVLIASLIIVAIAVTIKYKK